MNPVVVSFDGDAGDSGVCERLRGFDGAGKVAGKDRAGVEQVTADQDEIDLFGNCLLYTSPSPRDRQKSRMPSSA